MRNSCPLRIFDHAHGTSSVYLRVQFSVTFHASFHPVMSYMSPLVVEKYARISCRGTRHMLFLAPNAGDVGHPRLRDSTGLPYSSPRKAVGKAVAFDRMLQG
jgi:hypothetical protein